jgi:hypothetical protein
MRFAKESSLDADGAVTDGGAMEIFNDVLRSRIVRIEVFRRALVENPSIELKFSSRISEQKSVHIIFTEDTDQ